MSPRRAVAQEVASIMLIQVQMVNKNCISVWKERNPKEHAAAIVRCVQKRKDWLENRKAAGVAKQTYKKALTMSEKDTVLKYCTKHQPSSFRPSDWWKAAAEFLKMDKGKIKKCWSKRVKVQQDIDDCKTLNHWAPTPQSGEAAKHWAPTPQSAKVQANVMSEEELCLKAALYLGEGYTPEPMASRAVLQARKKTQVVLQERFGAGKRQQSGDSGSKICRPPMREAAAKWKAQWNANKLTEAAAKWKNVKAKLKMERKAANTKAANAETKLKNAKAELKKANANAKVAMIVWARSS